MDRLTTTVYGHRHRHIFYFKLVDSLHTQIFKRHDPGTANSFGNKERRTTYRHQVDRFMLSDGINRYRTALRFTDHPKNTSVFQHHFRKTVHPGGSRRTRGANDLIAHRVNRPNVVNKPPFEVYAVRQTLVSDPFVRRISSS